MAKAGALKEKIDRLVKKMAEGKEKTDRTRTRALHKRLKRAQRARRRLQAAEARRKAQAGKRAGEKKEEVAPASS